MSFTPVFPNTTNTHTWPFGTSKQVTIRDVIWKPDAIIAAVLCKEDYDGFIPLESEWYVLVEIPVAKVDDYWMGQKGIVTFRPGGPTLGYWEYAPI